MAQLIPQSFIDDLFARVDVVDVVSSRIKLKNRENYSACCPFHNEKTLLLASAQTNNFLLLWLRLLGQRPEVRDGLRQHQLS